jgi:hypothetical protein
MKESKVHIDDLFRQKEQPFVSLPPAAWDDMKLRLEKDQPKRGYLYRWMWYALSLLLVLGICFYLLMNLVSRKENGKPVAFIKPSILHSNGSNPFKATARISINRNNTSHPTSKKTITVPYSQHEPSVERIETANKIAVSKSNTDLRLKKSAISAVLSPAVPVLQNDGTEIQENKKGKLTSETKGLATLRIPIEPLPEVIPNGILAQVVRIKDAPPPLAQPISFALKYNVITFNTDVIKSLESLTTNQVYIPMPAYDAPLLKPIATATIVEINKNQTERESISAQKAAYNILQPSDSSSLQVTSKPTAFNFGVKAGYESGISQPSINKWLAAPYLQLRLSNRFSITLQPTFKYGTLKGLSSNERSYYNTTEIAVDSQTITKNGHPFWQITYTNTYDSITVKYKADGSKIEAELPLLLQYHLKNGIYFGTGAYLAYGRLITISEQQQAIRLTQTAVFQIEKAGTHPPPDTSNSFHHSAQPYSSYSPISQTAQSPLRVGYILSVSYEQKKWMVEAYLEQQLSGLSGVVQPDLKNSYRIPYLRIMLGYRLSKK